MQTESRSIACGNCGVESRYQVLLFAQEAEPPDLDTRPGESLRSSLPLWMKRCPFCGYCADDISSIHEHAGPVVDSTAYQNQLTDKRFPAKANEFICHAILLERVGQYADAGWTCLHAAWVCDDERAVEAAQLCRRMALRAWNVGKTHGQAFHDGHESEFLIVSDVHRRLGEFEHALSACNLGSDAEELPEILEHCYRLERSLIAKKNLERGSLRELPIYRGERQASGKGEKP